jgi:hypothetical protein
MVKTRRKQFSLSEAKTTGDKLAVNWEKIEVKQFRLGLNAELKDGTYNPITNFSSDDPILIGKMVRAHLNETPDYYTQWAEMEKAAARDHRGEHDVDPRRKHGAKEKAPCLTKS